MRWIVFLACVLSLGMASRFAARALAMQRRPAGPGGRAAHPWLLAVMAALTAVAGVFLLALALPELGQPVLRLWTGIGCAVLGVAVVCLLLRLDAPLKAYLPLLLFFGLPQFQERFYTLFHSFLHYSITYEVFYRGLGPENPLMAGEPLRYMYGVHVLVAWLMKLLPISPPVAFAALDALGLYVFAFAVERIARRIDPDPLYRLFTVIVALFGLDIYVDGPLYALTGELFGYRRFGAPVTLQKFTGINTNQVGLICVAFALLAIVRVVQRDPARLRTWLLFIASAVSAGVFYQPAFMAIGAVGGALAVAALLWQRAGRGRDAWLMLAALTLSSLVAAPVILGVSTGTPGDPAIQLFPGWQQLKENLRYMLYHWSLPLVLLVIARRRFAGLWRQRSPEHAALLLSVLVLQGLYLVVFLRFNNEYKLLGFATVAMAPLGAIAVREVHARLRQFFPWLLLLLFMPAMTDFTWVTLPQRLTDPITTTGRVIHHRDADEDALYGWVRERTPVNAVFIDSLLTIPAIAGRQLYVGLDIGRDPEVSAGRMHNGWLIDAGMFQRRIMEVDEARLDLRQKLATELLQPSVAADPGLLDRLRAASPAGRPLYVVARTPAQDARLGALAGLQRVYSGQGRTVYQFSD